MSASIWNKYTESSYDDDLLNTASCFGKSKKYKAVSAEIED